MFDWNTTILITLDPNYKDIVYGLCGNFNGDTRDDFAIHLHGVPLAKTSVELAQAYRVFDGDHDCCIGCEKNTLDNSTLLEDLSNGIVVTQSHCDDLIDPAGPFAHCQTHLSPDSFYQSCIADLIQSRSEAFLKQATTSYSVICEELSDYVAPELTIGKYSYQDSYVVKCFDELNTVPIIFQL